MTWQCRLIEKPELNEHGNVDIAKREIGDMWFLDVPKEELKDRDLSDYYFANNADRQPLVVVLPSTRQGGGKAYFLIDGKCFNQTQGHYGGWIVTGAPPNITVSPSINMEGSYHGYLQNGVIGDQL